MNEGRKVPAKLDDFEADLERSFGNDEWTEVTESAVREQAIQAARLAKSERTNIRLSEADLVGIKQRAQEKGLGYQTLIASLVHQYVAGRLVEINAAAVELAKTTGVELSKRLSFGKRKPEKRKSSSMLSRSAGRKSSP